jgi:predicted dehydrogenase
MSKWWLKALGEVPEVVLAGFVDIRLDAAEARRAEYGKPAEVGSDLGAQLKALKPDLVFDCSVPEAHHDVTLAALGAGCHVLGEKPMAENLDKARDMVRAAAKAGKLYAVIQNRRYDPRIRAFRSLLAGGKLGRLHTLHSDFFLGPHFGGFREAMDHVLLLDMAIHSFDAARYLSGADPVAVTCQDFNPPGSWYQHGASAVAVFEMSGGLVYTYRGSWCAEGLNTTWECDWRALAEKGSATWDGADRFRAQAVQKTGGFMSEWADLAVEVDPKAKQGGHAGILREFVDCVLRGGVPETVCSDNLKSLAMVTAAIESAETGKKVLIEA